LVKRMWSHDVILSDLVSGSKKNGKQEAMMASFIPVNLAH
jgi:hypothetical protein